MVKCLENLAKQILRNRKGNQKTVKLGVSGNNKLVFLASPAIENSEKSPKERISRMVCQHFAQDTENLINFKKNKPQNKTTLRYLEHGADRLLF